ncbi:MAG: ABC transporter permease [Firmicutes bacterium]|nr:ABC transporter permease [Bacillota bacterium]
MTVFKTFWKVVNKYKGTIILYTVMLLTFGTMNLKTNDINTTFTNSKPDVLIIDQDESLISKNLVDYFDKFANLVKVEESEDKIDDALFYRDVSYVIYIPYGYEKDILNGINPELEIKSAGDYEASLANMLLSRYINVQNIYSKSVDNDELIEAINNNLANSANVNIVSKMDNVKSSNMASFFNFASYSIMAVIMYIICLVLSSFHDENVNKRTIVSSMNYKKYNRLVLISSFGFSFIVWILYTLLGFVLLDDMLSIRGVIYIINTFVFSFCALNLALLISSLTSNKNAINGIVNVLALGQAFLCGAFIPAEFLPEFVLKIAHIFPSYWYINSNNLMSTMEVINFNNMKPVFANLLVLIIFSIVFMIINNFVSLKKQVVD